MRLFFYFIFEFLSFSPPLDSNFFSSFFASLFFFFLSLFSFSFSLPSFSFSQDIETTMRLFLSLMIHKDSKFWFKL